MRISLAVIVSKYGFVTFTYRGAPFLMVPSVVLLVINFVYLFYMNLYQQTKQFFFNSDCMLFTIVLEFRVKIAVLQFNFEHLTRNRPIAIRVSGDY